MADLDVTKVDGPHNPELTVAAAELVADAVRFLNYATAPWNGAPGVAYPGDIDQVLGHIAWAATGLQQTLDQLRACLRRDLEGGRLRVDDGQHPAQAVEQAAAELLAAAVALETLRASIARARRWTAWMSLTEDER